MTMDGCDPLPRLFGFLLGSTLSGAGVYSYVVSEYKTSNELLTEDIYVRKPPPPPPHFPFTPGTPRLAHGHWRVDKDERRLLT